MWTKKFWQKAAERAVKTAGQFGVGALGMTVFTNVDQVVNGGALVGFAMLFGGVSSVLTSMASIPFGPEDSPSVVK